MALDERTEARIHEVVESARLPSQALIERIWALLPPVDPSDLDAADTTKTAS